MPLHKVILTLLLSSVCLVTSAQKIGYNFERISTEQGLTGNRINDMVQDKTGFLWIATNNGLNRFDGIEVKQYINKPGDSTSLSGNAVLALYCDKNNNLWVLTINYLQRYNRKLDCFESYLISDKKESYRYENKGIIISDLQDNLWISAPTNGLFLLKKGSTHCERVLPYLLEVSSLYADPLNRIWIGKNGGDLISYNYTNSSTHHYKIPVSDRRVVNDNYVWHIWPQGDTAINLMLSTGFYRVSLKDSTITPVSTWNKLVNNREVELRTLLKEKDRLWIGSQGKGLFILNTRENTIENFQTAYNNKNSLSNNSITCIVRDASGVYWIASKDGLNKYDPAAELFAHYQNEPGNSNSLHYNFVSSFCEAPDGRIWIGTFGQGIAVFDKKNDRFQVIVNDPGDPQSLVNNTVRALEPDMQGHIWVGTIDGLTSYDTRSRRFTNYRAGNGDQDLLSDDILSLLVSKDHKLYVGTNGKGLCEMDLARTSEGFKNYSTRNGYLHGDKIRKMIAMRDGSVCLGTLGAGVDILRSGKVLHIEPSLISNSVDADYVNALCEDRDGRLWIGTWDGLFLADSQGKILQQFGTNNGLASGEISGILCDGNGDLWVSSMNGLSRLKHTGNGTYIITNYSTRNGLQGTYFTAYSTLQCRDGEMYFGGYNGFNRFYPASIPPIQSTPKVIFTDFQVFNQSVPVNKPIEGSVLLTKSITYTSHITIGNKQKVIGFRFAALSTTQPDKIRYACLMKGIDPNWVILAPNQRSISYNNLPPGNYEFMVKASNPYGIWGNEVKSIRITVLPAFWKTWWAFMIYGLILLGLFWLAKNIRQTRLRLENQAMIEKVEREKDAEINQMKINFFTHISHDLRTPLTLIIGPVERLLQKNEPGKDWKRNLEMIQGHAVRLLNLVNQLLDFRRMESGKLKLHIAPVNIVQFLKEITSSFEDPANEKEIEMASSLPQEECILWIDADAFEKIFFNLFSNAVKFCNPGGKISLAAATDARAGRIEIALRNTGSGLTAEERGRLFEPFFQSADGAHRQQHPAGYGIGLNIVQNLVNLHHGSIAVNSEVGQYTEFRLSFPLGREQWSRQEEVEISEEVQTYIPAQLTPASFVQSGAPNSGESEMRPSGKILLVEDNADIRLYLKDILQDQFEVTEAVDGQKGLERAIGQIPDLIISDIMMPAMNGIEMCKRLKTESLTQHIPIVLLSARSSIEDMLAGYETGADEYISKPFNSLLLLAKINALLQNRKKTIEKFIGRHDGSTQETAGREDNSPLYADSFVNQVVDFIKTHLDETDLSSETLEKSFHCSKMQLYRKLKAVTGLSVNTLIRDIRLNEARRLLTETELTISEIAYQIGFSDPLYFSKFFKKLVGVAPQQFRKTVISRQ